MAKSKRTSIPKEISARVLYNSDNTCCVCRNKEKEVQIHHIDGNPNNHNFENLSVLCFDCHDKTQIRGGFGRKLDGEQIKLYRDNWHEIVAQRRIFSPYEKLRLDLLNINENPLKLEIISNNIEIYKEMKNYSSLALLYDNIGNNELRDKYIELALKEDNSPENTIFFRCLQNKRELIPENVINERRNFLEDMEDYFDLGRLNYDLELYHQAAIDYIKGINQRIGNEDTIFTAAYYLKEFVENDLIDELFIIAYRDAIKKDDLWWQIRACEELGWYDEIKKILIENSDKIENSDNLNLKLKLAQVCGDNEKEIEIRKKLASEDYF